MQIRKLKAWPAAGSPGHHEKEQPPLAGRHRQAGSGGIAAFAFLALAFHIGAMAADWPQTGGNPQHTNYTPDSPAPPYTVAWTADFWPEVVWMNQPVIAAGRVFVTTLNGNLYALDDSTGKRLWHFPLCEANFGSPAAGTKEWGGDGKVFAAGFEGMIYALDAASGQEVWKWDAGETISGSPCLAEDTLFIGTRKGHVLALGAADGKLRWKTRLSWGIESTVAWHGNRVFAVSGDLRAHCLDAKTGKLVWTSEQMYGQMMRDFYPVIHQGKVLVPVRPIAWSATNVREWNPPENVIRMLYANVPKEAEKPGMNTMYSLLRFSPAPPEWEAEQQRLIECYAKYPEYQSLFVLNEADGKQAYQAVHSYINAGLHAGCVPPTICADGTVIVGAGSFPTWINVSGRLDIEKNRMVDILFELPGPGDNSSHFTAAGNRIVWYNCQNGFRVLDLSEHDGALRTHLFPGSPQ